MTERLGPFRPQLIGSGAVRAFGNSNAKAEARPGPFLSNQGRVRLRLCPVISELLISPDLKSLQVERGSLGQELRLELP